MPDSLFDTSTAQPIPSAAAPATSLFDTNTAKPIASPPPTSTPSNGTPPIFDTSTAKPIAGAADSPQPITPNDHQTLSTLKQVTEAPEENGIGFWHSLKQTVAGPGTIFGTLAENAEKGHETGQDDSPTWGNFKRDLSELKGKSLWSTTNTITDKEKQNHPHQAAVDEAVSKALDSLGTPSNIALLVATYGSGPILDLVGQGLSKIPAAVPLIPKVMMGMKAAQVAASTVFSATQIDQAIKEYPGIVKDFARGDTDKAIEDITSALISLGFGAHAGMGALRGTRGIVNEVTENNALKHTGLVETAHDLHEDRTLTEGQKKQIGDFANLKSPDLKRRETLAEFVEASRDPATMASRHAETVAGPTTTELINEQGKTVPFAEEKPVTANASGESAASQEAINRVTSEKTQGIQRYRVDTRSGVETPIPNTADAVDIKAQPFEEIRQRGPDGDTLLDRGTQARPFTPRLFEPTSFNPNKTFYHGTKANVSSIDELAPDQYSQATGLMGLGTYLTDNPNVASGYSTTKGRGAGILESKAPETGRVLGAKLPPGEYLDAETPVSSKVKDIFEKAKPADAEPLEGNTIRDLYKSLRARYADEGWSTNDAMENLQDLTIELRKEGYVGLRYEGGKTKAGQKYGPHNVVVIFPDYEGKPIKLEGAVPSAPKLPITEESEATVHDLGDISEPAPEDLYSPAGQRAFELRQALDEADVMRQRHVTTSEERTKMAEQQDPNFKPTKEENEYLDFRAKVMNAIKERAQKLGILSKDTARSNYVMHHLGYDDNTNSTMQRIYPTMHEGQQAGLVYPVKDIGALDADSVGQMGHRMANARLTQNLKSHSTNEGLPLAIPGGYVAGQRVGAEAPKSYTLSDGDVRKLTADGRLAKLVKSGDVTRDPKSGNYVADTSKYKPLNLYEDRQIGSTPIPPKLLDEMRASGHLDQFEKKGLVYSNDKGEYFSSEPLTARVQLYGHPDVADYVNEGMIGKHEEPTSFFGRMGARYDYITGNAKSLMLAWSPFHKTATEPVRLAETVGIPKAVQIIANPSPPIDYFNLTPEQREGIRNGLITAGYNSASKVSEGLAAGSNTWGGKSYKLFNKALEKLGVPEDIRNKIDPQKIFTDNVFGPHGQITRYKFASYPILKPKIADIISHEHPDWEPWKVNLEAGREAARQINNKFGGFNLMLAGRSLQDQKWLRRILLAPDFLETTGRSILDLGSPYGKPLLTKLIQFQLASALTAGAINYYLHHDEEDHSAAGALKAAHFEHPFQILSPDGKTLYSIRGTTNDFIHMVTAPREFAFDRVNPAVKATTEFAQQRNQYGRKEDFLDSLKAFPKATLPIGVQALSGKLPPSLSAFNLGSGSITEPTAIDDVLKSFGVSGRPARSPAEILALQKDEENLYGKKALTNDQLVRERLRFNALDRFRDALQIQDPDKKKQAVQSARNDIDSLTQRKIITPKQKQQMLIYAKDSRLKSIFRTFGYDDALDVWDAANDEEKQDLGEVMNEKFIRWREKLIKDKQNINELNPQEQDTFNHFRKARQELAAIEARPEPPPKPKPTVEKKENAAPTSLFDTSTARPLFDTSTAEPIASPAHAGSEQ